MTIQDLRRIVLSSQQQEQNSNKEMEEFLKRVHQKPFWLWNKNEDHERRRLSMKGNCCFTHITTIKKWSPSTILELSTCSL